MEKRIFVSHKTFGIGYLLEKNKNQPIIEVNFNHQLRKINNLDGLEKNKYLILFKIFLIILLIKNMKKNLIIKLLLEVKLYILIMMIMQLFL